jgi:hypothetical protein
LPLQRMELEVTAMLGTNRRPVLPPTNQPRPRLVFCS